MRPFRRRPDSPEIKRRGRGPGNLVVANCTRCGREFQARSAKATTCPACHDIAARERQAARNGPVRSLVDARGFVVGAEVRVPYQTTKVIDGRCVPITGTELGIVRSVDGDSVIVSIGANKTFRYTAEELRRAGAVGMSADWRKWVAYE